MWPSVSMIPRRSPWRCRRWSPRRWRPRSRRHRWRRSASRGSPVLAVADPEPDLLELTLVSELLVGKVHPAVGDRGEADAEAQRADNSAATTAVRMLLRLAGPAWRRPASGFRLGRKPCPGAPNGPVARPQGACSRRTAAAAGLFCCAPFCADVAAKRIAERIAIVPLIAGVYGLPSAENGGRLLGWLALGVCCAGCRTGIAAWAGLAAGMAAGWPWHLTVGP